MPGGKGCGLLQGHGSGLPARPVSTRGAAGRTGVSILVSIWRQYLIGGKGQANSGPRDVCAE